jgi:uncharacterized protein YndB with AHSA1/START domain
MAGSTTGFLLIADITGYTAYLSESELDHAQGTLTALLEVLLDQTRPPLVLSRLAGDAVISYALGDAFASGQTFVELIENTYVAFRQAIDRMVLNNTCQCTACANVGSLDLKFFVHWGTFARQKLSAHEELLGNDVNLLHRLLKNGVVAATGIRAYALYTQAAIDHLGLEGLADTMVSHREAYEHLGDVQLWVADMSPMWITRRAATRRELGRTAVEASTEIAMEASSVWDFLTAPEHLRKLLNATKVGLTDKQAGGRVAEGSVYHCFHGDHAVGQTVVEWTPFQRIVMESGLPKPMASAVLDVEYLLEPTPNGTRLTQRLARARGPWLARNLAWFVLSRIGKTAQHDLNAFKTYIEAEHRRRAAPERPEV